MTEKRRPRAEIVGRLMSALELPQDVFLDLPKVTIIGGIQLHMANHHGVLEYTPERIRIATGQGTIVVSGAGLKIASIYRAELVIDGKVYSVEIGTGE